MTAAKKAKPRKCRVCKSEYIPQYNTTQSVCSPKCAIEQAEAKAKAKQKKERVAAKREFRESDKQWCRARAKEELHRWVKYVRDVGNPCISCGNDNPDIKYDAGHFLSVGAHKELEMEPRNIHKQCSLNCNQHLSSNRAGYEAGLVERYGQEYLDWLLSKHEPKHYKAHDYLKIRDYYRELNKAAGVMPYQKNSV